MPGRLLRRIFLDDGQVGRILVDKHLAAARRLAYDRRDGREIALERIGLAAFLEEQTRIGFDIGIGHGDAQRTVEADQQRRESDGIVLEAAERRHRIFVLKRCTVGIACSGRVGYITGVVTVEIEFRRFPGHTFARLEFRRGKTVGHPFPVIGAESQAPAVGQHEFQLVVTFLDDRLPPERRRHHPVHFPVHIITDPGVAADLIAGNSQGNGRRGQYLPTAVADAPADRFLFLDVHFHGGPSIGRREFIDFGRSTAGGQCACKGGQQEKSKKAFHILGFNPYKITKKLLTL